MMDALKFAGQGTHVVWFGLTEPDCEIPVKPYEIFQKEITITASYVNPFTHGRAAEYREQRETETVRADLRTAFPG